MRSCGGAVWMAGACERGEGDGCPMDPAVLVTLTSGKGFSSLELQFHLWQERFDFRLDLVGVAVGSVDDAQFFEEVEFCEEGDAFFGEGEASEFEQFEVLHGA